MKVALVHDWLTGMRGGEKCLEVLCEIFPQARLFTLLHNKKTVSATIEKMSIETSFVQKLPRARRFYRYYLPLFPMAVEQFDTAEFDLVVSVSHCVAKGVITRPETCHICYCLSPMRYAWEMYHIYFPDHKNRFPKGLLIKYLISHLRRWDEASSSRVDYYAANSINVKKRIQKHYRRDAEVIYSPVDTDFFKFEKPQAGNYYLVVSALVPYKRVDLAIQVFNSLSLPLYIVGDGPQMRELKRIAKPNIKFLGWQPQEKLLEYYLSSKALIFPGEEDFGLVPLEAQACGKPVIAYLAGGALETVTGKLPQEISKEDKLTGIFFYPQTKESLIEAVGRLDELSFDPYFIRQKALKFDRQLFKEKIKNFVLEKFTEHKKQFSL